MFQLCIQHDGLCALCLLYLATSGAYAAINSGCLFDTGDTSLVHSSNCTFVPFSAGTFVPVIPVGSEKKKEKNVSATMTAPSCTVCTYVMLIATT